MTIETKDRLEFFRQQIALSEKNAANARTEEVKRAWLICAREWKQIAQAEALKFLDSAPSLAPEDTDKRDDPL